MMNNTLTFSSGEFVLTDHSGDQISIAGSTTSGLQELLSLCAENGMNGKAVGGNLHPFNTSETIYVPMAPYLNIEICGRVVANTGANPAFWFDTFNCSYFRHVGSIEYSGTGPVIQIMPGTVSNSTIAVQYSEIHCGLISVSQNLDHVVHIDPTYGAINNNKLSFRMLNCAGKANFGIFIISPNNQVAVNSCFGQNDIDIGLIVGAISAGLQEGNAYFNAPTMALGTNKWEIGAITTQVPLAFGAIFCGLGSIVRIGSISVNGAGNDIGKGIYFGGGSYLNHVTVTQNEGLHKVWNTGLASNVVIP